MTLLGQDKTYIDNRLNIDYVHDRILEVLNIKEFDMTPYQKQEFLTSLTWLVWATLHQPE